MYWKANTKTKLLYPILFYIDSDLGALRPAFLTGLSWLQMIIIKVKTKRELKTGSLLSQERMIRQKKGVIQHVWAFVGLHQDKDQDFPTCNTCCYANIYLCWGLLQESCCQWQNRLIQFCVKEQGSAEVLAPLKRCLFKLHLKQPEHFAKTTKAQINSENITCVCWFSPQPRLRRTKSLFVRGQTSDSRILEQEVNSPLSAIMTTDRSCDLCQNSATTSDVNL